jgi:hypothetical protein
MSNPLCVCLRMDTLCVCMCARARRRGPEEPAGVDAPRDAVAAWLQQRRRMLWLEAEVRADRFLEMGKRTLAVLRGEFARFEMRSREVRDIHIHAHTRIHTLCISMALRRAV